MLRDRKHRYVEKGKVDHVKLEVMRMLEAFEDAPGFESLKNILLRPFFVDSRETAEIIRKLYSLCEVMGHSSRKCSELKFFDVLLGHMTPEEKARHAAPLLDMFKGLMTGHRTRVPIRMCCYQQEIIIARFATLYVEMLRGAEDKDTSGKLIRFVEYVLGTTLIALGTLLQRMNPNSVDYLLTCFSNERFHAGGIRETDFLMDFLSNDEISENEKMLSVVLIRHGFNYSYHQGYYENCFWELLRQCPRHSIIRNDLIDSENLRMQMAVQILVPLLCKGHYEINRELICTLWESLPDPFITPDELYHLMEPFFVQGSPVLLDACARYRELFPGVPLLKQPRSLKHLARVRIRVSMVRAHTLGERAVRSLCLPKAIEDYLWKLEAI